MTATGQVATRYASALIDLADQAQSIELIEKDMLTLKAMLDGSADLQTMISNPLFNRDQQQGAILALAKAAELNDLTTRFLAILAHNRRLSALPAVMKAVQNALTRRRGGVEAKVQTAVALSPAQTEALKKSLSDAMGSDVTIHAEVNKDLLGGMVVTVGSRMIDDSVKRKLERLKRTLSGSRAA
jgi:F-type H+-transporting ATPase subunit delta